MGLKSSLKEVRDRYVIRQAESARLPQFELDVIKRYRFVFKGRVQKVGFRLEVSELAKRLELTGFCRNLETGEVLAELQGPESRIMFLVTFMEGLMRIKIKQKTVEELALISSETGFFAE